MTKTLVRAGALLGLVLLLVACGSLREPTAQRTAAALAESRSHIQEIAQPTGTRTGKPYIGVSVVEYNAPAPGGKVTVSLDRVPLRAALRPLAERAGYSLSLAQGVDGQRPVSAEIKDMPALDAVRDLATSAGYVALVNVERRQIAVADRGQYLFKVDPQVLQSAVMTTRVGFATASTMAASAGASGGSASGTSGAGTGGNLGLGSVTLSGATSGLRAFETWLRDMLGEGAQVAVSPEAGLINVRGNALHLARAREVIERWAQEGLRQIDLEFVVIDVALKRDFQFGIDWSRVIPLDRIVSGTASAAVNIANAGVVSTPALNVGYTSASVSSVLRALETFTSVRVIAEPHLLLRHSVPAQSRSVVNRPYVPSVSTAITGTTTAVASTTASAAQVPEGVTFTALANVVDSARISLWLVPQIVTMQELVQFKPSSDTTLTVPVVPVTEAAINVIAESGKTIVVGGLRRGRDARTAAGVPGTTGIPFLRELLSGVNDMDSETEVVMLVRASVIPAPRGVQILAAESL